MYSGSAGEAFVNVPIPEWSPLEKGAWVSNRLYVIMYRWGWSERAICNSVGHISSSLWWSLVEYNLGKELFASSGPLKVHFPRYFPKWLIWSGRQSSPLLLMDTFRFMYQIFTRYSLAWLPIRGERWRCINNWGSQTQLWRGPGKVPRQLGQLNPMFVNS